MQAVGVRLAVHLAAEVRQEVRRDVWWGSGMRCVGLCAAGSGERCIGWRGSGMRCVVPWGLGGR
jgi:hypothetical protein